MTLHTVQWRGSKSACKSHEPHQTQQPASLSFSHLVQLPLFPALRLWPSPSPSWTFISLPATHRVGQNTQPPGCSLEHLSAKILWSLLLLAQGFLEASQTLQAKPAPACLVCERNLQNWQSLQMQAADLPSWGTLKPDSQEAANPRPKGTADFAEGGFSSRSFSRGPYS